MSSEKGVFFIKYSNLIFGVLMLLFAVGYLVLTLQVPVNGELFNGRFFPLIIDFVMFVLTAIQFVTYFRTKGREPDDAGDDQDGRTVLLTVGLIVVYIASMQYIGFVLSTFLYLFFQFIVMTPRDKKIGVAKYLLIALISSVGIYLVFRYTELNVMLPQGIFTII